MRLDFNILWVEDEQASVEAQRERLETLIRAEGFRLKVQFARSVAEAREFLSDSVFSDHVDLVLMDYNLEDGPNGDAGLKEVRRVLPYKDIIFYSAQGNNLRDLLYRADVTGVYLSNRDDLPDTADEIFQMLVKKVLDIDHSRGLVMGATSDIDHHINDSLESVCGAMDADSKEVIFAIVEARLKEIKARFEDDINSIRNMTQIGQIFDKHAVYTSVDRLHLLRKALRHLGIHNDKDSSLADYAQTVMPRRNELAHVRVKINGFTRKLVNKKGAEFTAEEMKALRLALLEKQEIFETLSDLLRARRAEMEETASRTGENPAMTQ